MRGGEYITYGGEEVQSFGGEPEGKGPLGKTRRGWEYNIKMDLQELGWGHGLE